MDCWRSVSRQETKNPWKNPLFQLLYTGLGWSVRVPHDLPQLQHAILGALLGFGGPKRLGDGQDGLSSMVTGHVSFANTDNIGNFAVFHFGGLFLILYQPIRLSKHVRTARVRHLTPIHDSSGIAFHDAAATGDVDIQQRMEEHLAHCALLTAVAQDAAWEERWQATPSYHPVKCIDKLLFCTVVHPTSPTNKVCYKPAYKVKLMSIAYRGYKPTIAIHSHYNLPTPQENCLLDCLLSCDWAEYPGSQLIPALAQHLADRVTWIGFGRDLDGNWMGLD